MITPSFGLTSTERVLPRLALDFTTASLDSRVTFTRTGNTATVTNSSGVIVGINADLPRFDYNPTTLACKGLLIEEARTNLLLNSLIDGTNLTTQIVVTTAVSTTLSFYGTGEIVLSGTSSATVTGTGAYPSRKTHTFTPTAGALTLTVTGTVQYAQLEVGGFATSFIPTAASQVTRTADLATMTGTNFSDWYNADEGTFNVQLINIDSTTADSTIFCTDDGLTNQQNQNSFRVITLGTSYLNTIRTANVQVSSLSTGTVAVGSLANIAGAYKLNSFAAALNGGTTQTDTGGALPPSQTRLRFGLRGTGTPVMSMHLQKLNFWPQRLINNEVRAFSK